MRAGELREKIALLRATENEWGEEAELTVFARPWARVLDKSGANTKSHGAETSKQTITVKLRWRNDLQGNEWIEWFGDRFSITHIQREKRRGFMILTCESNA